MFCVVGLKFKLVVLYVDFKLDESYTPSKISIRAGDGFHNLKVLCFYIMLYDFEVKFPIWLKFDNVFRMMVGHKNC